MNGALQIALALAAEGIAFYPNGEKLRCVGVRGLVPQEKRGIIAAYKPEILDIVTGQTRPSPVEHLILIGGYPLLEQILSLPTAFRLWDAARVWAEAEGDKRRQAYFSELYWQSWDTLISDEGNQPHDC